MFKKIGCLFPAFLLAIILAGCGTSHDVRSSIPSSAAESVLHTESVDNTVSETTTPSESSNITSVPPETTASTSRAPALNSAPAASEATHEPSTTASNSSLSPQTPSETAPPSVSYIASTQISVSLSSYQSANEPTPYVKDRPIYQVLYNGKRAQVGDTLSYTLQITPITHSDKIFIDATSNVACRISGTTLTVTVVDESNYNTANITIYTAQNASSRSSASANILFTIDPRENPYNNFSTVLGDYISAMGMQRTLVENGYTAKDPSLSITKYPDAPKWDDEIKKSNPEWLSQCFSLIDAYSDMGFQKVSFISTETSVAFCASY